MNQEHLMNILIGPHTTEKSTRIGEKHNQYVFKVAKGATKPEVKAAVELMFNVKVEGVNLLNVKGKIKRFAQREGKRSDWKKAYIRLVKGEEIQFGEAQ